MISKPSLLLLAFAATSCVRASYPPFDLIDDYVNQFRSRLHDLNKLAVEHRHKQEDYHEEVEYKEMEMLTGAEEYDFIIVGSGTSGSVLASRLSEEPKWKILVLEAGDAENSVTKVPSMHPHLQTTPYTWEYWTVPQNFTCLGMEEHKCIIRKGKGLGGDTVVNDMLYTRGHQKDYNIWADAGLQGWCWQSLAPYFKKIENACVKDIDKKYRHYGGPIHLEDFRYHTSIGEHLHKSCEGPYKKTDYNGKEQLGFGKPQVIAKDGKRHSVAMAYYDRTYERENLHVKLQSTVVKVIIGEHTKEAVGVKYIHKGKVFVAKASKEIILAAGAINTPQILLLSGVGPKEDLEHLEIPVIADLHVGHHLQDHVSFTGLNFVHNVTHDPYFYHSNEDIVNYLKNGAGPLVSNGLELVGFIKTHKSKDASSYPDIEFLVRREHYKPGCEYFKAVDISPRDSASDSACEGQYKLFIEVILLHPKSKGYLKLHSKDPLHQPLINPNGLSDEDDEDIETLVAGIQEALKFAESEPLQKIGLHLHHEKVVHCDRKEFDVEYWKCAVRHLSIYRGDITGTAKMGLIADKEAVVDQELRVHGIHKLRVADASIIPVTLSGNVMAPEIVIGEKAADLIKHHWLE